MNEMVPENIDRIIHYAIQVPRKDIEVNGSMSAEPAILLMNHNRDAMDDIVSALHAIGLEITVSDNLLRSIRAIRERKPDLIILNPLLLDPSGVELEQICRARGNEDLIPLLLIVEDADGVKAIRLAKKALGEVQDFVLKPFTPEEIVTRVELILLNREKMREIEGHAKRLEGQLITDFKTSLFNDRHFEQRLREEFGRASRHSTPLSCLLLDVDDFKTINDTMSYESGDAALRGLAEIIRKNIRVIDFPARIGGDEFSILLPHTTMAEAVYIANRIREAVSRAEIHAKGQRIRISVSIGVGTYHGRGIESAQDLVLQANAALKEAKSHGKNRIWVFSERLDAEKAAGGGEPTLSSKESS